MVNNYARSIFRISVGALCAALTVLTSCKKNEDDVEKDTLTVSVPSLSIPAEGGRKPVTVKSSSDWQASCPEDWVEITVNASGTGFYVAGEANPHEEVRYATISVTNLSGFSQDIAVSQAGITPVLEVDKQSVEIDVDGTPVALTVTSNVEFKAECSDGDWLKVSVEDDRLIVSAKPTTLFEERSDTIYLVPAMSEFERLMTKIVVKQQAREYAVSVAGDGVENGTVLLDAQENEVVLSVVANSDWSASCEAEWIKIEPAEGKATDESGTEIELSVAVNEVPQSRSADVVFTCGSAECKVAVEQRGAGIYLEMDDAPLKADDGQCEFVRSVKTNGTLTVETSESWVSAEIVQDEVKITVQPNTGVKREAVVTVISSSEGVKETVQVQVSQLAFAVDLSGVETANCYVVNRAGTYKIKATVKGNGANTDMLESEKKSIAPNGAMLVWATDTTGCIGNVSLSGDYIYFETDGTNGNALVAATLDEYSAANPDEAPVRTILWSWHIWMTDFDIEAPINQYEVGGTAYGIHATFMGRNLGAMTSGESGNYDDILGSFGMQYQWGRKDPFPPAGEMKFDPTIEVMGNTQGTTNMATSTNKNSVVYYYNEDGSVRSSSAVSLPVKAVSSAKRRDNIAYAVEHPQTYITSGNPPYMWVTSAALADVPSPVDSEDPWGHLWGNPTDNVNHVGDKSIYDPCPAGWQVPAAGQWAFISSHGSDIYWWFAATCPWKYNHKEALEAYEAGKITCNTDKITEGGGSVAARKANCYVRMTTMKGGFHIYYTSHNTGNESKEYNWLFQEYESYADGPTMFLPAAGQRSYLGYNIRTGFGAQYHSSSVRSVSGTAGERVQSHGTLIDYQGHQTFTYNVDYEQLAAARSVRCVKTEE